MKSIFTNKNQAPTSSELEEGLASTSVLWKQLEDYTLSLEPKASAVWHFSGEKFGWSYRIKDSKRVLVYLLPRDKFFKVAFVFGQKATDEILASDLSANIKTALTNAKVYAEGRGIRLEVKDAECLADLKKLITIKIAY